MAKTKDEKYIICAYEMAKTKGSLSNPVNRYEVGTTLGMNPKGVDAVCRWLAQANFIKNSEGAGIVLTDLGKKLVENLQDKKN